MQSSIDNLNIQVDTFESEIESLSNRKKKDHQVSAVFYNFHDHLFSCSKSLLVMELQKAERKEELQSWLVRHRFHISKLETVMRMLDNNAVDTDKVLLLLLFP